MIYNVPINKLEATVWNANHCTKKKDSIKGLFSKFNQIGSFLRIWSHLLKKCLRKTSFFVQWIKKCLNSYNILAIKKMKSNKYLSTLWKLYGQSHFKSSRSEVFCKKEILRNFNFLQNISSGCFCHWYLHEN